MKTPSPSGARGIFAAIPAPLLTAIKVVVTLLAVWLIWNRVDFRGLQDPLKQAAWGWLGLFIAVQYVVVALNAVRWQSLVAVPGTQFRKYLYYVFVGSFLSLFLPSAALAEGLRVYAFGRRYGDIQRNFAATLFARACGFLIQIVIVAVALAFAWDSLSALGLGGGASLDTGPLVWMSVCVAASALAGAFLFRARLRSFAGMFFAFVREDRSRLARVLLLSLAIQACAMLSTWALYRSVGAELLFWHIAVIPTLIQVALLLPVSFGGVGVREYLGIVLFTGWAGLTAETTLAAGILSYTSWIALAATGGFWMLYRRQAGKGEG